MHLMHVVTLHVHDKILCELHGGSNEAPQPTDCYTIAAMIDIALVAMIDIVLVAMCNGET